MSIWRRIYLERRAVLLPLLVVLAGNLGVLALVVFPLQRSVVNAEEDKRTAAMSLAAARLQDLQAKAQRTGKERADVELQKFYAEILPRDHQSAVSLINFWLARIADRHELQYRAGQLDADDVRDSRLMKLTGKVTLIGDYANVLQFLYDLETAEGFVVIESVELSQSGVMTGNSMLEIVLSVATYYIAPTGEVAKK